jgi:hypothetical protein
LSRHTRVKGAVGLRRDAPPLIKRRLDGEEARTTTTLKVGAAAKRSNWRKMKKERKLEQNYEKSKLYLFQLLVTLIGRDLCLYRQHNVALTRI